MRRVRGSSSDDLQAEALAKACARLVRLERVEAQLQSLVPRKLAEDEQVHRRRLKPVHILGVADRGPGPRLPKEHAYACVVGASHDGARSKVDDAVSQLATEHISEFADRDRFLQAHVQSPL